MANLRYDHHALRPKSAPSRIMRVNEHHYEIYQKLGAVDKELAQGFFLQWERDPAQIGLRTLDVNGMGLCRAVDGFHRILVSFIGEVFKKKPETLLAAFDEKVDVADVFSCGTLDEFRQRVAARTLRRLGRFSQVRKFIKKLDVDIKLDRTSDALVTSAIALRNLVVHNGGLVDEEFLNWIVEASGPELNKKAQRLLNVRWEKGVRVVADRYDGFALNEPAVGAQGGDGASAV